MRKSLLAAALALTIFMGPAVINGKEAAPYDGNLREENGTLLPMLSYSDPRDPEYSNEGSDILRFCVYVETDNDTDNDGLADLVKVFVQVPRSAAEGKYKASVIYDPTPYNAGTNEKGAESVQYMWTEKPFDYDSLYRECEKRTPEGEMSTLECAMAADPARDWNYRVPISQAVGYSYMKDYDYFLVRGFAVVEASGIGTCGSEGFELCGTHLERDSHKAVVEWLTGDRKAFTDNTNRIEIKADWSNGKVAMTGCSYGGTLPFEVATTGVKGLETIIPFAGIASWYDYTNSQGVPTIFEVSYADYLSGYNAGGTFLDKDWLVTNKEYGSWLWQMAKDQLETNGNYGKIWDEMNYAKDWENISCSALIVQGLNDFNVQTKHADLMAQAFEKAGKPFKMVLHQDGHNILTGTMVNGELWNEIMLRWLAHYLYDIPNDAEEMPAVLVQSNLDGSWNSYDSWRDFHYIDAPVGYERAKTVVKSKNMAQTAFDFFGTEDEREFDTDYSDAFYASLPDELAAKYPIELEDGTTVYGVPEIHLKLSSEIQDYEGLMITSVLVDMADDGSEFNAYVLKSEKGNTIPVKTIGEYEWGGSGEKSDILEYVQDTTQVKAISYGWTDLTNPGCGYDSSEYTETTTLEAGEFYDYTLYMEPTVYTVAPGHHLYLILTTWDPFKGLLDESTKNIDTDKASEAIDYDYSYIIDNEAIQARMPVAQ